MTEDSKRVAQAAKQWYEQELQAELEREHSGKFLCIEPMSRRFYLGNTFDEAVNAALDEFPDRITHTLRIGHAAALHLGVMAR